jgi:hypothetical protein
LIAFGSYSTIVGKAGLGCVQQLITLLNGWKALQLGRKLGHPQQIGMVNSLLDFAVHCRPPKYFYHLLRSNTSFLAMVSSIDNDAASSDLLMQRQLKVEILQHNPGKQIDLLSSNPMFLDENSANPENKKGTGQYSIGCVNSILLFSRLVTI